MADTALKTLGKNSRVAVRICLAVAYLQGDKLKVSITPTSKSGFEWKFEIKGNLIAEGNRDDFPYTDMGYQEWVDFTKNSLELSYSLDKEMVEGIKLTIVIKN